MPTFYENFMTTMADQRFIVRAPSDGLLMSMPRRDLTDAFILGARAGGLDIRRDSALRIITDLDIGGYGAAFEKLANTMRETAGAMADLWISFAKLFGLTTSETPMQAAERLAYACLAGEVMTARQIRHLALEIGTSEHYGRHDSIAPPSIALFEAAARVCDEPFSGGDFGAWLFLNDGDDW